MCVEVQVVFWFCTSVDLTVDDVRWDEGGEGGEGGEAGEGGQRDAGSGVQTRGKHEAEPARSAAYHLYRVWRLVIEPETCLE